MNSDLSALSSQLSASVRLPYYRTPERQAAFIADASSWIGTPFSENCAVRGRDGGVSCDRYQAALHIASGACPSVELPVLPVEQVRRWGHHHTASKVTAWLELPEVRARVQRVDDGDAPMIGDLVVLRVDQTTHHLGAFGGAWIFHVAIPAGVVAHSALDPELRDMVRAFYRLMETALNPS